jgi:phosphoglycolate phosphatase-like HAD superfamily hydrolase
LTHRSSARKQSPVLQELSNRNIRIALASYNADAVRLLQLAGIFSYFTWIIGYDDDGKCKASQLRQLIQLAPSVTLESFHLFDDLVQNVEMAQQMGMSGVLVDYSTGVRLKDLKVDTYHS